MKKIGILALQGNYHAHGQHLSRLSTPWQLIITPNDLAQVDGLIIPGGESTALLNLMQFQQMDKAIIKFAKQGNPIFGTCAGMILLATNVTSPVQKSLNLINIDVERNAYGRQIDSFTTACRCDESHFSTPTIPAVFIRAPRIVDFGPKVTPIVWDQQIPVMLRQDNILVAAFHPEMTDDSSVHHYFMAM